MRQTRGMTESTFPRPLRAVVCLVLTIAMGACAGQSGDRSPPASIPTDESRDLTSHSTVLDDLTRNWTVYRPPAAEDPSAPVMYDKGK